jgi:REP element-mobilizing transposase RayT
LFFHFDGYHGFLTNFLLDFYVAEAAEETIKETCKELDIEIIDMAVGVDYIHL